MQPFSAFIALLFLATTVVAGEPEPSKPMMISEAKLPAAQRAKFSTFDGVVRMDANGQHPPEHKH